jgi:Holliday junction DNA helicase RuvB
MEDYALDFIIGKGPAAKNVRLPLPKFTLIGATTRIAAMTSPLRDRFGIICRLELYSPEELKIIVGRTCRILNISIDEESAVEIASRSRGTPRIANRLVKRVRDYAEVRAKGVINLATARKALKMMDVDELGLDHVDRTILSAMIEKFNGGPVGLITLAAATGEEAETIEDVYEPYLLQLGFIARTPRGRVCLAAAYRHLGLKVPEDKAGEQLTIDELK